MENAIEKMTSQSSDKRDFQAGAYVGMKECLSVEEYYLDLVQQDKEREQAEKAKEQIFKEEGNSK